MRLLSGGSPGSAQRSGAMLLVLLLAAGASCQVCPGMCSCAQQTVKCQNRSLDAIPKPLPLNTRILFVTGNNISRISADSFPDPLEQLTDLSLSGNELQSVDAGVFKKFPNLLRLDLSNNSIQALIKGGFPQGNKLQHLNLSRSFHNRSSMDVLLSDLQDGRLPQLTTLDLSNNDIWLLPGTMFSHLPSLVRLSLRNNSLVSVSNWDLAVPPLRALDLRDNSLSHLPNSSLFSVQPELRVQLGGNPWNCDCVIEDMLLWLKNSTQVSDKQNLTCSEPPALRGQLLLQLEPGDLKCMSNLKSVLETSYVFLGLVLALIGVIFLLVLYLNRKGIKRWMYNIRDACRDHMEGYHYRYEINSDPRLANLSINSDV